MPVMSSQSWYTNEGAQRRHPRFTSRLRPIVATPLSLRHPHSLQTGPKTTHASRYFSSSSIPLFTTRRQRPSVFLSDSYPSLSSRSSNVFTGRRYFSGLDDNDTDVLPKAIINISDSDEDEEDFEDEDDEDDDRLPFEDQILSDDEDEETSLSEQTLASTGPTKGTRKVIDVEQSPLRDLNVHYLSEHGISTSMAKHMTVTERKGVKGLPPLWTATFVCPVTGQCYDSGSLSVHHDSTGDDTTDVGTTDHVFVIPVEQQESSDKPTDPNTTDMLRCFYKKKSTAIQAAAGRAIDIFQYETLGILDPRYCDEDPSLWQGRDAGSAATVDSDSAGASVEEPAVVEIDATHRSYEQGELPTMAMVSEDKDGAVLKKAEGDDEDYVVSSIPYHGGIPLSEGILAPSSDDETSEHLEKRDSEEEEYVVTQIPTHRNVPPSERILASLSSTISAENQASFANETDNHRMPLSVNPLSRVRQTLDMASAWVNANKKRSRSSKNPHRVILPQAGSSREALLVGKTVLSSLAETNQSTPITEMSRDIEKTAEKVFNIFLKESDTTPDPETYGLFLKCLVDSKPLDLAEKAQAIVQAMKDGKEWKGHIPPKPDVSTMNSLIQLWAQVGGKAGRYDAQDLGLELNRWSYLSMLSANTYYSRSAGPEADDHLLDIDYARMCIDQMRKQFEANPNNASLRPDTQVYNAALRWSGGSLFKKSRPYARYIPWDNFKNESGPMTLKEYSDEDGTVVEAKMMEVWLQEMMNCPDPIVSPDIETYEALIQAWVRTATRKGLERAQELAEMLLQSPENTIEPRLQTFRPLLMAWLWSGELDTCDKVTSLISMLDMASEKAIELRPDGRTLSSIISAHVFHLIRKLPHNLFASGKSSKVVDSDLTREVKISAEKCTKALDRICREWKEGLHGGAEQGIFLETQAFGETLLAWQYVARLCICTGDAEGAASAITEMENTVEIFHSCLEAIKIAEEDTVQKRQRRLSFQFQYLLANAHGVYSAMCEGLRLIDKDMSRTPELPCLLPDKIILVESMMRRGGELELLLSQVSDDKPNSRLKRHTGNEKDPEDELDQFIGPFDITSPLIYGDLTTANPDSKFLRRLGRTREDFLLHVVSYLKYVESRKTNTGDYTRLCVLAKECMRESCHISPKVVESMDVLERLSPSPRISDYHLSKQAARSHATRNVGPRKRLSPRRKRRLSRERPSKAMLTKT